MNNRTEASIYAVLPVVRIVTQLETAALNAQVDAAIGAIRLAATPSSTWNAYMKALRYIGAWTQVRFGESLSLPVSVHRVQLFVIDHFGRPERQVGSEGRLIIHHAMPDDVDQSLVGAGYKSELGRHRMTTIDQRLAVLSWAHREKGLESPCHASVVRRLLADCRKLALEYGRRA